MGMFRIVAKGGKVVGKWEKASEFTVAMMNDLAKVCNQIYKKNWVIEYK